MRCALLISTPFSIALPAQAALSGDSAQGRKLHDANCVRCHSTSVYTRQDRHIKSLDALNERLGACSHAAQVELTDEEQESIVKYLNEQFYEFK
jgi:mono/diheme cytochrome c family protein